MQSCKNAIEEIVIQEVQAQLAKAPQSQQNTVNINDVAAYALNRLPPMYATSQEGWSQQRRRAMTEFMGQIEMMVRRALVNAKPDVLRDMTPLPEKETENQALALAQLQQLFGVDDMTWRDLPAILDNALMTIKLKSAVNYTYMHESRRNSLALQEYLRGSDRGGASIGWKGRNVQPRQTRYEANADTKDFVAYMNTATYSFRNVLEKLALSLAYHQVQKLHPELAQTIDLGEVMAYTLNRLPTMYATTERGYRELRQRAKEQYGRQVVAIINEAIGTIMQNPKPDRPPLPFARFEAEQEEALDQLQWMLQRDDITWRNVKTIVEASLQRAIEYGLTWRRYNEYENPTVAEIRRDLG
jgi:hypothetical protein